ncbi:MAG TPA: hypothetical protein VIV60_25145 [Polyangiaceae bacterium]
MSDDGHVLWLIDSAAGVTLNGTRYETKSNSGQLAIRLSAVGEVLWFASGSWQRVLELGGNVVALEEAFPTDPVGGHNIQVRGEGERQFANLIRPINARWAGRRIGNEPRLAVWGDDSLREFDEHGDLKSTLNIQGRFIFDVAWFASGIALLEFVTSGHGSSEYSGEWRVSTFSSDRQPIGTYPLARGGFERYDETIGLFQTRTNELVAIVPAGIAAAPRNPGSQSWQKIAIRITL